MQTDWFDGLDRGTRMGPLPHLAWILETGRRLCAGLARVWTGKRKIPSFDDCNDHMLADVGLRRDELRGLCSPEPWFLGQHLRWTVDASSQQGGPHGPAS
jgi:hypothetical protein